MNHNGIPMISEYNSQCDRVSVSSQYDSTVFVIPYFLNLHPHFHYDSDRYLSTSYPVHMNHGDLISESNWKRNHRLKAMTMTMTLSIQNPWYWTIQWMISSLFPKQRMTENPVVIPVVMVLESYFVQLIVH